MQTKVRMGANRHGKAVFAIDSLKPGEHVIEFSGAITDRKDLPYPYEACEDRFLQIGPNTYMGASGSFDDYINHSCDPNCGLKFEGERIWVTAIRAIAKNEEITFDYSTSMDEDEWELDCNCKTPGCRGSVGDFKNLPKAVQDKYIALGVIPEYLLAQRKK